MPSTHGSSQLDGYDFTRIKAFSDDYYVGSPSSPSDGDVLVYNSTTGLWEGRQLFRLFSAYDNTGGISIGQASAVDLTYDTEVKKDSIYTHTTGAAGITVTEPGFYLLQGDISVNVSAGSTASYVSAWAVNNGTEIDGTRAFISTPASGARASASINRIVELADNDVIKIQAQLSASGNTVATVADSSRLTLTRVGGSGSTPPGSGGVAMGGGIFAFITYP